MSAGHVLDPLHLSAAQRREAMTEFDRHPEGVARIALDALRAQKRNPQLRAAAIFLSELRAGHHRNEPDLTPRTGWRFVRGTHSGTYVRDPDGMDVLPRGYGATG